MGCFIAGVYHEHVELADLRHPKCARCAAGLSPCEYHKVRTRRQTEHDADGHRADSQHAESPPANQEGTKS